MSVKAAKTVMGTGHRVVIHNRRVRVLAEQIAAVVPPSCRILDVGCGDGLLDRMLMDRRPGVEIHGVDVLIRPETHIPVTQYDGRHIPHPDKSFDAVMLVDVLHHTEDPLAVMRECARVSAKWLIIKDHVLEGIAAWSTLKFMDWVGNTPSGVALPYNYWTMQQWQSAWSELGLSVASMQRKLGLYPLPAAWFFERQLHLLVCLQRTGSGS